MPDRPAVPTHLPPDRQRVTPQRQLPEAVCGFRRPGRADQPLTAVVRCYGQAKQEAHPFTTFGVSQRASTGIPRCLR